MTKANVGEAPRSGATQRYPQQFNEEICSRTPEENTSELQDVIQMSGTDLKWLTDFPLSNGEGRRHEAKQPKRIYGKFQAIAERALAGLKKQHGVVLQENNSECIEPLPDTDSVEEKAYKKA